MISPPNPNPEFPWLLIAHYEKGDKVLSMGEIPQYSGDQHYLSRLGVSWKR